MSADWSAKVDFDTVYIKEAHPTDEWQMDSNEDEGVCYPQPKTIDDRFTIARDFKKRFEWPIPLVVDEMSNAADDAYAGWPGRLYVVDASGIVRYKGKTGPFGFEPEEVEAWLAANVVR